MSRIKGLLVVLALAVVLAGCGHGLTEGTVIGHDHTGAWTQFIPITVGKVTTITPIFHPEQRQLRISECETQHKGCKTSWVDVDPATYERYPNGSYYRGVAS